MTNYLPMRFLLGTQRLILRPWTQDDFEVYRDLIAERGKGIPSTATVRAKIAAQHRQAIEAGITLLAIHTRLPDAIVGYCGLTIGRATVQEPEIAYEILQHVRARGYATEAGAVIVEAAIATGRQRIWATTRPGNAASLRVAEKLGFYQEKITLDQDGEIVWMARTLSSP